MNVRSHIGLGLAITGLVMSSAAVRPADAQRRDMLRIAVMTLHMDSAETDREFGSEAADELRKKLQDQFNKRDVYVFTTREIGNTLEASGFPPHVPLPAYDERALAKIVQSDYYVAGTVVKVAPKHFRVETKMFASRGEPREVPVSQPLPVAEGDRMNRTMEALAKDIKEAMKQVKGEQACIGQARTNQLPEAIASAREAIVEFPQATLARMCMANVFYEMYRTAATSADSLSFADSVLNVSREILHYDSLSVASLKFATELYKVTGDSAQSRAAALKLVEADPGNTVLMEQVINELASTGHASDAVPLVSNLVEQNPGDLNALRTAFLVYLSAGVWDSVVATGPKMIQADTIPPDTTYFLRMAVAYDSLQQPKEAANILGQATTKFPSDGSLWLAYSKYLEQSGQAELAAAALKKAAELTPGGQMQLQLLGFYDKQNQGDSVFVVLTEIANSATADSSVKDIASQIALKWAGNFVRPRDGQPAPDSSVMRGIEFAKVSDQLFPSDRAKYLVGGTVIGLVTKRFQVANETKSCEMARGLTPLLSELRQAMSGLLNSEIYGDRAKNGLEYQNQVAEAQTKLIKQVCN